MNKFSKLGLVALILFHQKCKALKKKGYTYFYYFWDTQSEAIQEAKESDLLKLDREVLVKKAMRAKGNYPWAFSMHCVFTSSIMKLNS